MSMHDNILPIMGNHEYLFGKAAPGLFAEITEEPIEITLTMDFLGSVMPGKETAGHIYHKGNFYDLDCGCVTGGRLGALCLETGEKFYTDSLKAYWHGSDEK